MGIARYTTTSLLALSLLTSSISAKCSHDIAERGLAQHKANQAQRAANKLTKRQAPTSLAQQEALTDPDQECTPYSVPWLEELLPQYPPIWEIASIVPGDEEATSAFNAIVNASGFPNYPPKGTPQGDFSTVVYNATDPDCWWSWSHCDTPKVAGIPKDVTTCPEPQTWGLSFDDGPNCTETRWLDYLQEQDYTATLFYIGSNVVDWPFQAQHGFDNGHEIAIHTWSHRYSTALTNEQFFAELWYTRKAIKTVLGITPTTWRAPYGDVDDRIRAIANGLGLRTIMWDHDMFDWQVQNAGNPSGLPTSVVEGNYDAMYALSQQGEFDTHGTVVLTHEINASTMNISMLELPSIAGNFKHIVPVATCQNNTQPYNETNWRSPTFEQYLATNSSKMVNGSISVSSATAHPTTMATTVLSGSASKSTAYTTHGGSSSSTGRASGGIAAQAAKPSASNKTSGAELNTRLPQTAAMLLALAAAYCTLA